MEQADCAAEFNPQRHHRYRWKFWGFSNEITENPCVLKESPHYFKTELACMIDAKVNYTDMNVPYTVVVSVVNEPRACFPDYNTMESRMKTFLRWPPCIPFSAVEMAEAGFFYTGQYDKVMCFACGKGFYKWDPKDNPWEQHKKHSPECYHLRYHERSLKARYMGDC